MTFDEAGRLVDPGNYLFLRAFIGRRPEEMYHNGRISVGFIDGCVRTYLITAFIAFDRPIDCPIWTRWDEEADSPARPTTRPTPTDDALSSPLSSEDVGSHWRRRPGESLPRHLLEEVKRSVPGTLPLRFQEVYRVHFCENWLHDAKNSDAWKWPERSVPGTLLSFCWSFSRV